MVNLVYLKLIFFWVLFGWFIKQRHMHYMFLSLCNRYGGDVCLR